MTDDEFEAHARRRTRQAELVVLMVAGGGLITWVALLLSGHGWFDLLVFGVWIWIAAMWARIARRTTAETLSRHRTARIWEAAYVRLYQRAMASWGYPAELVEGDDHE
jgi:hypothetical protein